MPTPFPGMDPYLERPDLWPNVHSSIIVAVRDDLAPRLRPKYYVAVEERLVHTAGDDVFFGMRPDVAATQRATLREAVATYAATPRGPTLVEVPLPDVITEAYLELRTVEDDRVVTVLELLSPTNKRPGRGRTEYELKRLALLGTATHLVEVDLLRAYAPLPLIDPPTPADYRILVSRSGTRPMADLYAFGVRDPIPAVPVPLLPEDEEPRLDLNHLLHALYDRAGFDLRIDYGTPPVPPLTDADAAWAAARATNPTRANH